MTTEQELKTYAQEKSCTVLIRARHDGSCGDCRRQTTKQEAKIIESAIFGALLAIRSGSDVQAAKDTAEYIADLLIPGVNGYISVYQPIGDFVDQVTEW